ncbi:MAG: hypothetical protein LBV55_03375 [Acholeplasmatales bacterium]|nr:hypothetical protein [Acholeplasmatales bacterium]
MWWETLSGFQQAMFIVATTTSGILLIFLILSIVSLGSHADFDDVDASDFDSSGAVNSVDVSNDEPLSFISGFRLFTLRGALVFLGVMGWASFALNEALPWWASLLIGISAGAISAVLVALLYKQIYKLEQNGNLDYRYSIGKQASVYIKIPNNGQTGKIIVQFNDRYLEVDAVSNETEDLLPGTFVKIVSLKEDNILVVEKV